MDIYLVLPAFNVEVTWASVTPVIHKELQPDIPDPDQ